MKRKQTLRTEVEKTIRLLVITLGVIITFLLVVFLFQTGNQAQLGYQLEQARQLNDDLKDTSQLLKAKVTGAQSSNTFDNSNELNDMAAPEDASNSYLLPEDNN